MISWGLYAFRTYNDNIRIWYRELSIVGERWGKIELLVVCELWPFQLDRVCRKQKTTTSFATSRWHIPGKGKRSIVERPSTISNARIEAHRATTPRPPTAPQNPRFAKKTRKKTRKFIITRSDYEKRTYDRSYFPYTIFTMAIAQQLILQTLKK